MKDSKNNKITRKQALKKAGAYAAFTAAASLTILSPAKGQATSMGTGFRGGSGPVSPPDDDDKNSRTSRPSDKYSTGR